MNIIPSTLPDINDIFAIYDSATVYQKKLKNKGWQGFERTLIAQEINEQRHFKIMENNDIACTFVIAFSDPTIWKNAQDEKAIYLHRIATHPNFRGRGYINKIIAWAKEYATKKNIDFIRMDTHSGNEQLNAHYIRSGFTHIGIRDVEWTNDLPEHYKTGPFSLFEIKL